MTTIKIKPVTKQLDTLEINGISVYIDNSANINVSITDGDLRVFNSLYMDAETYAGWGDDDTYVVNWVMKELGLSYPTK